MRASRWTSGCVVGFGLALALGCGGDEAAPHDEVDSAVEVDVDAVDVPDDPEVSDTDADAADASEIDVAVDSDDAGEVDATDDVDTGPASSGFAAHGLVVRVLAPGALGTAEATSSVAVLSGALFGNATAMRWQMGQAHGDIAPAAFWQSEPLTLQPGDNAVTVTATDGVETVSDSLVITYNPAFRFDDELVVRPRALWVGAESEVVFTMKAPRFATADRDTIHLLRVDALGGLLSDEGQMRDDGRVSTSGDEIEQDGVFTFDGAYACTAPGPMYFRVSVKVGAEPAYTAVSATVRIDCLERVTSASCAAHKALVDAAGAALEGGAALADVQSQLAADAEVAAVGPAEDGGRALWVQFADGLLGAVALPDAGVRGSALSLAGPALAASRAAGALAIAAPTVQLASKRALVLSPRATAFGEDDEGAEVAAALDGMQCPSYEVAEGRALADGEAGIERFRSAAAYGIVAIATEGEVLFGGMSSVERRARWQHDGPQEVLWTGSPVSCEGLLAEEIECQVTASSPGGGCPIGARCVVTKGLASDSVTTGQGVCVDETQVDLRLGNALITNRGYAVTPGFFEAWRGGGFPSSFVHLGACRSLWNGSLAASLYASGALAVSGFSGVVGSAWAKAQALSLFEGLAVGPADGTVGALFAGGEDPDHAGTHWRLFGASNLDLASGGLLNGDFETGSLVGWSGSGDGRAVSQFGAVLPVSGKGMGLVSSGLGFSVETGTLEQTFCLPEDRVELSLSWKFMSEEFKEWCGNAKFQDRFKAEIVDSAGGVWPIVEVTVDDLCAYTDGTCAACPAPRACDPECFAADGCYWSEELGVCEGEFNCQCGRDFVGLSASSIGFDQGGVYEVMWRKSAVDISALAGQGPVTLRLSVGDSGDSLFDTAVLIDGIEIR